MLCSQLILVKWEERRMSARVLSCRSWNCELCAPDRKRQLVAKGMSGNPTHFLTLTVNPSIGSSPVDRARRLVAAWRTVRQMTMQYYGYDHLEFLAVFEATQRGEPHLHILLRCPWLDHDWISAIMEHELGAPVVWIERLNSSRKAAGYVAKYCGKAPDRFDTLKRYWTSRGYEAAYWRAAATAETGRPRFERRDQSIDSWLESVIWCGLTPVREGKWWCADVLGVQRQTGPPEEKSAQHELRF